MLQPEMHDSENGTHSAAGAETLVLTNNSIYPEPPTYYDDVINIDQNHHHHHHLHNQNHQDHYEFDYHNHHQHLSHPTKIEVDCTQLTTQLLPPTTPLTPQTTTTTVSLESSYSDHRAANNNNNHLSTTDTENQIIEQVTNSNNNIVDNDIDEEGSEEDDDDGDDEEEEDEDEVEEDDEDDEDEDDDDEVEEEEEEEEEDEDESEDDSEDIVDPGQNCHQPLVQQQKLVVVLNDDLINADSTTATTTRETTDNDILDGERMLEVTRKLVRSTERDPDRDLRKQVLLKTAIKRLPHFMEYNRYSDSLDRSFHTNMSPQAYYEQHHDSQQKFYHSVQPNAIQMSTTSLRMLDLNDHENDLNNIEQDHHIDPNLSYNRTTTSLEQHDCVSQHQYERYHQRAHDFNHYEPNDPIINRHNSLENLYQPINGSDSINVNTKDGNGDERIPIAFQIACEIYDFTCAPDDNERKLLDNLTNGYYTKPTKEPRITTNSPDDEGHDVEEDVTDTRDQDGSDTSSSSQSSTSDESANSLVSQKSTSDLDETNGTSLLEASLNSSSDFYHSSHDSGVALFNTKSNKRSSSSIGLDDDMDIDHLTELSTRTSSFGSNNQYKKLRKREIID